MDLRIVETTCSSVKEAESIGRHLIESKLAGCVNVINNVSSLYRWKTKIVSDNEVILVIKTSVAKEREVVEEIKKNHSYDIPAIIVYQAKSANNDYSKWIEKTN